MSSTHEMGQARGALSAAAGHVADARHDFDRLDDELLQHLDAARATWSGQGGSAFHALGRAWAERQLTITRALDDLEASLRATEHDNTSTDDTQSAAFLRVQQRLG